MEHDKQIWCDRCGKYIGSPKNPGIHTCSPNPVIEKLRAENEALRKDADRYRFAMRECDIFLDGVVIDNSAIDAAMKGEGVFRIGDRVTKIRGSNWTGRIVGTYSTSLTPEGYAVESETERGSVQIYPAAALRAAPKEKK